MMVQRWAVAAVGRWATSATLVLSACLAEGPTPRPGWTPREIEAQRLCTTGQAPACGELGRALVTHVSSEKDVNRGTVLLETSCAENDALSCTVLGRTYRARREETAIARARDILTRACDLRSAEGCADLGALYGTDPTHDPRFALDAYRRSCELGAAQGCYLYGSAQRTQAPGVPGAGDGACIRACGLGDLESCYTLGRSRIANPATRSEGVAYLLRACRGGHPPSCLAAAELFAPVLGSVPSCPQALPLAAEVCVNLDEAGCVIADACSIEDGRDPEGARQRLRLACDRGISLACFYWANAAGNSPADRRTVEEAYDSACRHYSAAQMFACTRLAVSKLAVTKDPAEIVGLTTLLTRACDHSVAEACCALAETMARHNEASPEPPDAPDLRAKACNLGDRRCCPP